MRMRIGMTRGFTFTEKKGLADRFEKEFFKGDITSDVEVVDNASKEETNSNPSPATTNSTTSQTNNAPDEAKNITGPGDGKDGGGKPPLRLRLIGEPIFIRGNDFYSSEVICRMGFWRSRNG